MWNISVCTANTNIKFYGWIVWHIWNTTVIFLLLPWWPFKYKSLISENKESSFVLKCCYSRKRYLSKLKQHGLPDVLCEELLYKCLSVMIYEQFTVSIVELIMLSWQPILLYNFYNMIVTWLFYHFFKLQVHILHNLENISIFNIWKLSLVRCDVIFNRTSLILPKMSENFWSKEIPFWWFPDSTLKLNNSRTAWPIPAIYISFSSIWNALLYEINLFSRCSSPLRLWAFVACWSSDFRTITAQM